MKIGIVGMGAVGASTAMALMVRERVSELTLVNRNRARARGVAVDMRYGAPLSGSTTIADGDYRDLAGAAVVIVAAGVNERAGGATDRNDAAGRLRLLGANIKVFEEIVPSIVAAAPEAVILVATDPPDPLVDVARGLAKHERVMGTGTYLDSLRFRVHVAERLGVSPASVDAYVVGEHGTSSVFLWSVATVGGRTIEGIVAERGTDFDEFRRTVEHDVRYANISIIEGIGASQYGIGVVTARIAEVIAANECAVLPVGGYSARFATALSLPRSVGRGGIGEIFMPDMSDGEAQALERSAERLRNALAQYRAG
jgi:L-lactate dehydrogenase